MAAVAVVAVAVILVVLFPRLTGGHAAHGGATGDAEQGTGDGSSLLRLSVAGLLFGGWALAFTVGIWRRWRIRENEAPDYDTVSEAR